MMRQLLLVVVLLAGCAELHEETVQLELEGHVTESSPPDHVDHHDSEHIETVDEHLGDGMESDYSTGEMTPAVSRSACAARWVPNVNGPAVGRISYESARRCTSGAQSGARRLGQYIQTHFPNVLNPSTANPVQIFNCRHVRGGGSWSLHSEGRAIDLMVPLRGGAADNQRVDRLANWLVQNAERIGIQYIIWDRAYWRGHRSPQTGCYTGSHPHNNHIHVELTWAAAREETAFFQGLSDRPPTNDPEPDSTEPEAQPGTPDVTGHWLGHPCRSDEECAATPAGPARCFMDPAGAVAVGVCTQACAGYCPDRDGDVVTFCIPAENIGSADGGLCVAKAQAGNGQCGAWLGFEGMSMQRHVGGSRARSGEAVVCIPARGPFAQPAPDDETAHESPEPEGFVCADSSLPSSRHGVACPSVPENTWRCGCDQRFERPVSQVCRHGGWINYQLDPADCSRCDGRYTRGCE